MEGDPGAVVLERLDAFRTQRAVVALPLSAKQCFPVLRLRDGRVGALQSVPVGRFTRGQAVEEPCRVDLQEVPEIDVRPAFEPAIVDE